MWPEDRTRILQCMHLKILCMHDASYHCGVFPRLDSLLASYGSMVRGSTALTYYGTGSNTVLSLSLSAVDINAIKQNPNLTAQIFLSALSSLVADTSGLRVTSIPDSAALPVRSVVNDTRVPALLSFDLKMDDFSLPLYVVLHFDETVQWATVNSTYHVTVDLCLYEYCSLVFRAVQL